MLTRLSRLLILISVMALSFFVLSQQNRLMANGRAAANNHTLCQNDMAGTYPCHNIDLLSYTPKSDLGAAFTNTLVANLWGWTDPDTTKEYILLGLQNGTAFVDVTDPISPTYLGLLPTRVPTATPSVYRDMKVYQNIAYIIADTTSQNGMQIFDLTNLRGLTTPISFTETAYYEIDPDPANNTAHNIFIHEETGYAYLVRNAAHCSGGAIILDLQDPLNPSDAGCFNAGGAASDIMCVIYHGPDIDYQGREICLMASDDDLIVGDVTSKTNTVMLAALDYPNAVRSHLAWFTEDHRYFLSVDMNDEQDFGQNTRIFIWDASDLDDDTLQPIIYDGPTTGADHNIWVKGDYAFIGNLHAGLRILNLNYLHLGLASEAAYFDNYPIDDNPHHGQGAWAVYPYFDSGTVAVSDRQEGLFLLRPQLPISYFTYLPILNN
ncbi:MAG: choice-of-anchor B family protein [Chloroflexi bacterium]|nr:choice-of-anchor B family protein [Chloroflexota bacterium]